MSVALLSALLFSSPYPFEIKTGIAVEPTVEVLFKDKTDKTKAVGGVRLSYLNPDVSDALITSEVQILSATSFSDKMTTGGNSEREITTDYFFEAGFVFYEIYHPVAFRLAAGGGAELRRGGSPDIYYRAGLGHYFSKGFGIFGDLGGRWIFRSDEKASSPINVGVSVQLVF